MTAVDLPLYLTVVPNPDLNEFNCAICGHRFKTPICGVLSGVPGGGNHFVCGDCILKPHPELLVGAIQFKGFLDLRAQAQGQLCQHLEHCQIENRPTKEEIDQYTFDAQVGQPEDENGLESPGEAGA